MCPYSQPQQNIYEPLTILIWPKTILRLKRKTMIRYSYIWILLLVFSGSLQAQQDAMYTKYMFNSLAFNPAYAGTQDFLSVDLIHRQQWFNWGGRFGNNDLGAPISQSVNVHAPYKERVGWGINLTNDIIGARNAISLGLNYAYRVDFGVGKLSLGLRAGGMYWSSDWSKLSFKDDQASDPAFNEDFRRQFLPTFGAGLYFYSEQYYIGFSVPNILSLDMRDADGEDIAQPAQLLRHYYFAAGVAIPIQDNEDLVFKPSILIKSASLAGDFSNDINSNPGAPSSFDLDASVLFQEKFWAGIAFRSSFEGIFSDRSSSDSFDFWFAYYLPKGFRIGASYDVMVTPIQQTAGGSFEIMLGFDLRNEVERVTTPRYF